MFSEEVVHRYVRALYPVALVLMLFPLMDLALRSAPPQFGSLQWRFSMVGILLGNSGNILLGAGLFGLTAALAGNRKLLRAIGIVGIVMAVVTLAVVLLFALDAVQMRRLATANYKRIILTSSTGAALAGLFATGVWTVLGRSALAAARDAARRVPAVRGRGPAPLVVAAPPSTGEAV